MWKPSKPVSLADFASGADNFEGLTLFEELPGIAISTGHGTFVKAPKKSAKSKTKKLGLLVKRSCTAGATPTNIPEDTESEPTALSKKKRKKKPAENLETDSTAPPKKKRQKRAVRVPSDAVPEPKHSPAEMDLAAVIEASGTDVSNWEVLHVPPELLAGLAELKYEQPTEIQRRCLPAAIRGRMDVVGAAETGSGKTLAFALPVLYGVMKERQGADSVTDSDDAEDSATESADDSLQVPVPIGPKALILAPTRELAIQVKNHIVTVAKYTGIKVVTVVGGMSEQKQQRLLSRRPEVVVATPGRLWEFVEAGDPYLSNLSHLRFLVVDETDRMLEKGHFQQLHLLLERVNADPDRAARRQNFVFSATLTLDQQSGKGRDFKQLKELTTEQKLKHITAMIGLSDNNKKVVDITRALGTVASLTEMAVSCSIPEKDELLYYFALQHPGRTLIFCNSIDCVTRLGRLFNLLEMQPLLLHANMQQRARLKSLQRFQERNIALLVATDVAARGLDVPGVQYVIHYQVPRTTDSYVHRSGRTARALSEGLSVMFVEAGEVSTYRKLLRQLNRESDLPPFSVDQDLLRPLSRHVALARSINLAEYRQRRAAGSRSWAERAAEEMDMELDDNMQPERDEEADRKMQLGIKSGRAQLREMLQRRAQVWQPFTRHGRLQVPARNVSALEVAKASVRRKKGAASPEPEETAPPTDPQQQVTVAPPSEDGDAEKLPQPEVTVASPSDKGHVEKSSLRPKKPKKKSKSLAAAPTVTEKAKPVVSGKRHRKKKWFARKGK